MAMSNEEIKEKLQRVDLTQEIKKAENKLVKMRVIKELEKRGCSMESLFLEHDGDVYRAMVSVGLKKEADLFSLNIQELNSKHK